MGQSIGSHLDDLQEFHNFMLQMQTGIAVMLAVGQTGLLDHLNDEPAPASTIAQRTGMKPDYVARVLRFLASQQVVGCDSEQRFFHTARSRLLQAHQSGLQFLRETMGAAQGLAECLRTGRSAFECHFDQPIFRYLAEQPDTARYFGNLMSRTTAIIEAFVFSHHTFEPFECAVDIGGSHGRLMKGLLERHP